MLFASLPYLIAYFKFCRNQTGCKVLKYSPTYHNICATFKYMNVMVKSSSHGRRETHLEKNFIRMSFIILRMSFIIFYWYISSIFRRNSAWFMIDCRILQDNEWKQSSRIIWECYNISLLFNHIWLSYQYWADELVICVCRYDSTSSGLCWWKPCRCRTPHQSWSRRKQERRWYLDPTTCCLRSRPSRCSKVCILEHCSFRYS